METLETTFKRDGYIQRLIKRTKDVAMYTVECAGKVVGYEVFKIREQKEFVRIIAGREVSGKHKELKPRNEDFGKTAFAPSTRDRAEEHFKRMSEWYREKQSEGNLQSAKG